MYIQYVGFNGTAVSRIYNFHVVDVPHEAREFTVEIQSEAFGPLQLRFQDGPDICFAHLKKGLEAEIPGVQTDGRLNISAQDVRSYLEAHHPVKVLGRKRREGVATESEGLSGPSSVLAQTQAALSAGR